MFIFPVVVCTAVLVTIGYLALWSAAQEKTSSGLAGFGRVMAIILFVLAGLCLLVGLTFSAKHMMYGKGWGWGMGMGCPMMQHEEMMHGKGMGMGKGVGMGMMGIESQRAWIKQSMKDWMREDPKDFEAVLKEIKATEQKK